MKGLHVIQVPSVIMLMITNQTPALQLADFKQILNKVSLITRIIKVKVGLSAEAKGLHYSGYKYVSKCVKIYKSSSNTKHLKSTWLPLEITHCSHMWYDYPWPRGSLTWLLYYLQLEDIPSADFKNLHFWPITKGIVRWKDNNVNNHSYDYRLNWTPHSP